MLGGVYEGFELTHDSLPRGIDSSFLPLFDNTHCAPQVSLGVF